MDAEEALAPSFASPPARHVLLPKRLEKEEAAASPSPALFAREKVPLALARGG